MLVSGDCWRLRQGVSETSIERSGVSRALFFRTNHDYNAEGHTARRAVSSHAREYTVNSQTTSRSLS